MLKTEEIREICDKHQLTRMEVYNIRSLFAGMCSLPLSSGSSGSSQLGWP